METIHQTISLVIKNFELIIVIILLVLAQSVFIYLLFNSHVYKSIKKFDKDQKELAEKLK